MNSASRPLDTMQLPLPAGIRDKRLNTPVHRIERNPHAERGGVRIVTENGTELFDKVVLAAHSDQSLALLAQASPAESQVLLPRIDMHIYCDNPQTGQVMQVAAADRRVSRAHVTVQLGGIPAAAQVYQTLKLVDGNGGIQLLNGLMIFEYENGDVWYDLNPIVLDLLRREKIIPANDAP